MKRILFLFYIFLFTSLTQTYAADKVYLKDVMFLTKPVDELVLEFNRIPQYKITKNKNKLTFKLFNVIPETSTWINKLPKNMFKEINISFEKKQLILEFTLSKSFNFKMTPLDTQIVTEFIWKTGRKPINVVIKGKKVRTLETVSSAGVGFFQNATKFPSYQLYFGNKKIELPLTKKKYHGIPITVDFQNADIHAVFRLLAEIGNINIIVSNKVKGTVTLKAKKVPWDLLFDAVLANNGLVKLKVGNIVRIDTLQDLTNQANLYTTYMKSMAQIKESLKNEIEAKKDIYKALKELQEEQNILITKTYKLKYLRIGKNYLGGPLGGAEGQSSLLVNRLKELVKGDNKITFDPFTNTIIVKATPKVLKEVERVIKELDKPRPQILIEARIVEVSDSYVRNLGIQWGGAVWQATAHNFWGVSSQPSINTGSVNYNYPGGGGSFSGTNSINLPASAIVDLGTASATSQLGVVLGYFKNNVAGLLDMKLSALEQKGVGRIISKPQVLTLDEEPAIIQQGYKIPYLSWEQNVNQATTSFINAGLKLEVVPSLTPDGKLLLDIYLERSYPDWGHTVNGVPTLITESIRTSAMVENGETLVLGGIKINSISENTNKVPGLADMPGAGNLFKGKNQQWQNSELLIFITPKIVYYPVKGIDY